MPHATDSVGRVRSVGLIPRRTVGIAEGVAGPVSVVCNRAGRSTRLPAGQSVLRGCWVSRALPVEAVASCELSMAFGDRRKSYRVLPSQLDLRVPFPIEESAYGFAAPGGRGGDHVIGLAVRDREMVALLAADPDQDPHVVDSEALALWDESLEQLLPANDSESRIVMYAGVGRLVVVAGRGSRYLGAQVFSLEPGGGFDRFVAAQLGVDRPDGWLAHLAGPTLDSEHGGLVALVERTGGRCVDAAAPEEFLARALARRAVGRGRYLCNLRSGRWIHPGYAAARKRALRGATVLFLMAAVVLLGAGAAWSSALAGRQRALEQLLAQRAEAVAGGLVTARGEDMLRHLGRGVVEKEAALMALQTIASPGCETLLAPLSSEAAALGFEVHTLSVSEGIMTLDGVMQGDETLAGLRGWLGARGLSDINVVKHGVVAGGTGVQITGRLP